MVLSYADMNDQQKKKYIKRVKREYGDGKVGRNSCVNEELNCRQLCSAYHKWRVAIDIILLLFYIVLLQISPFLHFHLTHHLSIFPLSLSIILNH